MSAFFIYVIFNLLMAGLVTTSESGIHVQFLKAVKLQHRTNFYFRCDITGQYLHWEYNGHSLSGYVRNDTGRVWHDVRTQYGFTTTLLSSQSINHRQDEMKSILVISFLNNSYPNHIEISCISDQNSSSIVAGNVSTVVSSRRSDNGEVNLEHIYSDTTMQSPTNIKIFVCEAAHSPQLIQIDNNTMSFSEYAGVGQAKSVLSVNQGIVIQGIVVARSQSQSVFLIFVSQTIVSNISCFDNKSRAIIPFSSNNEQKNAIYNRKLTPPPLEPVLHNKTSKLLKASIIFLA